MLSLRLQYWRKTIKDQIAVKLAENAYVKTLHPVVSFFLQQFDVNALLKARNILCQNATGERREAIRRSACNRADQAFFKRKVTCECKG
jgi:hypothetical protein